MNMNLGFVRRCGFLYTVLTACMVAPLIAAKGPPQEAKPADACFAKFHPIKAPALGKLLLKPGDRLAIVGDSISVEVRELDNMGWSGWEKSGNLTTYDTDK